VHDVHWQITAVHRLCPHGAVLSQTYGGTSEDGFDASWSDIALFEVRDGMLTRVEIHPDDNLVAALAQFDELRPEGLDKAGDS